MPTTPQATEVKAEGGHASDKPTDWGWPHWFDFDPEGEIVTLFGIRYATDFFRAFGIQPAGYTFKILERSDGVVTIGQERNALEAAAPDMLAALIAASHALRSYQYGNAATDLAREIADAADAAIAKAKEAA